jgi:hypothetical protein
MLKRVFIDSCNIAWMEMDETLNPDHLVASTKMYCGEPFDRIYFEDEVEYLEGIGWTPISYNLSGL